MKYRPFPVKTLLNILTVAVLVIGAGLLLWQGRQRKLDSIAARAKDLDAFLQDGRLYVLSADHDSLSNNVYFLRAEGEDGYLRLPGDAVKWCADTERFVYTDGKKVRTCGIDGKNRETLCKSPGGEYALVTDVIDGFAIVRLSIELGGSKTSGTGEWLAADLATGEIFGPFALAEETRTVHPVTVADGWLYFSTGSVSGGGASVRRYRLADGACETLTQSVAYSFDLGCVKDGYLYFSYTDYSGSLNRIPAAGGHVEPLVGALESVGLKQAVWLGGEDGSIYLAAIRSVSEAERRLILYTLDTETLTLTETGSVPAKDSTIRAGRLQDGIFTAVFHSDPPLCVLLNR